MPLQQIGQLWVGDSGTGKKISGYIVVNQTQYRVILTAVQSDNEKAPSYNILMAVPEGSPDDREPAKTNPDKKASEL